MNIHQPKVISVLDFDKLVVDTYQRPYNFQQQNGCQPRGTFELTIPRYENEVYTNDTVTEKDNPIEMGVTFKAWIERDPEKPLKISRCSTSLKHWWQRNFYPDVQMVANDLYEKGLIPSGDYMIIIEW